MTQIRYQTDPTYPTIFRKIVLTEQKADDFRLNLSGKATYTYNSIEDPDVCTQFTSAYDIEFEKHNPDKGKYYITLPNGTRYWISFTMIHDDHALKHPDWGGNDISRYSCLKTRIVFHDDPFVYTGLLGGENKKFHNYYDTSNHTIKTHSDLSSAERSYLEFIRKNQQGKHKQHTQSQPVSVPYHPTYTGNMGRYDNTGTNYSHTTGGYYDPYKQHDIHHGYMGF